MIKKVNTKIKLTIAYVTFNRLDLIKKRVYELLKLDIPPEIEIIVIDDCSTDGTYESLKILTKKSKIKVYKNKTNYGFSRNFFEAIKRSKGEFSIWTSDKDGISIKGLNNFLNWSKDKEIDVAVLNYKRKMTPKEGHKTVIRKNPTRIIKYNELWKCSHGPGIVWRKESVIKILSQWKYFYDNYNVITKYYPNLVILVNLLPNKKSYFFNNEITYQTEYAKFSHFSENENSYNFLKSRWIQHKNLIDMISEYAKIKKYNKFYKSMSNSLNLNLHSFLSTALREERPDLYSYWWKSFSSPIQIFIKIFKLISFILKQLIYEPTWTIKKIKKRYSMVFKRGV